MLDKISDRPIVRPLSLTLRHVRSNMITMILPGFVQLLTIFEPACVDVRQLANFFAVPRVLLSFMVFLQVLFEIYAAWEDPGATIHWTKPLKTRSSVVVFFVPFPILFSLDDLRCTQLSTECAKVLAWSSFTASVLMDSLLQGLVA